MAEEAIGASQSLEWVTSRLVLGAGHVACSQHLLGYPHFLGKPRNCTGLEVRRAGSLRNSSRGAGVSLLG
jgi:hypothetical protein